MASIEAKKKAEVLRAQVCLLIIFIGHETVYNFTIQDTKHIKAVVYHLN